MSDPDHLSDADPFAAPALPLADPPVYEPPIIELRMPLETTAAFCDTAMQGKEFGPCFGPINS